MSRNNIIVGIDIGSANIRTVIAQDLPDLEFPRVIGVGTALSFGIRKGVIVDVDEVAKLVNESLEKAERMAGVEAREAIVNIGGAEISFQKSKGVIAVGRADGEVTENDVNRVIADIQNMALPLNREVVHIIPKNYRLDDHQNIKDPIGMKGVRLEAEALVIECSVSHVRNITKCVNQIGLEISELVLDALAASKAVLNKKQKELGVMLVNIGGGTTSVAIFEEGNLLHTAVLPVGSGHVTNDIAIGLRTSVDVAEKIKIEYGNAVAKDISRREEIDLSKVDSQEIGFVSRHHVGEIIEARLEEIFSLVRKELKSIGKDGLLPSGVVLTGGGSKIPQIVDLAKSVINLPVHLGFPVNLGGMMDKVDDVSFSSAIGLVLWEREQRYAAEEESGFSGSKFFKKIPFGSEDTVKTMRRWIEKILP